MKRLWILLIMPLPWTAVCADGPMAAEKSCDESEHMLHKEVSSFSCSLTPDSNGDSTHFVTVNVNGREIRVKVAPGEKDPWKVPCTFILDNGEVVHHYCDGLHHTPHQGQERWKISEPRGGVLFIEKYLDTARYGPYHQDPENIIGRRPVPSRLEYFTEDYSRHLRSVDLTVANPYSREKIPDIELEQVYDPELGLSPDDTTETTYLWNWSWVHFFDSGHAGICWRLQRYSGGRGLQGFTTTILILDQDGKEIVHLANVDEDISSVMVTTGGKYLGVVLNSEIDINAFPKRLGLPGIRIYNTDTSKIVYQDIGETEDDQFEGPFKRLSTLIYYSKLYTNYGERLIQYTFLDFEQGKKYVGLFNNHDIESGIVDWSMPWDQIVKSDRFSKFKID